MTTGLESPGDESIAGIWKAIDDWLRVHAAPTLNALRPGANNAAIANLEHAIDVRLPAHYRESLMQHDGGAYLTDYEYLSVAQVASVWR